MTLMEIAPLLGNFGEFFGAIAVVVSLVFVAYSVRHNTFALQQASHQSVLALLAKGDITLATNESFHRMVTIAETSPGDISEEEWSRFTRFVFHRMGVWEYLYLAKHKNALLVFQWLAFDPYFAELSCLPGYRRFWEENLSAFAPAFRAYLETEVLPGRGE